MSPFINGDLLSSLPNELLFKILEYLDVSSYYSFHNINQHFFHLLFHLNCSRAKEIRKKAKNHLVIALGDQSNDGPHNGFRRYYYYSDYFELVRGTPIEYVVLNVSLLTSADIRRLISEYRGLFKYNLLNYIYVNLGISSVVLSYKFLCQFYQKESADFRMILYTLKTLGYEASVNFSSIHEIRSLEGYGTQMPEHLYLCNYQNKNPVFSHKFETLRSYPSEIILRVRTTDLDPVTPD